MCVLSSCPTPLPNDNKTPHGPTPMPRFNSLSGLIGTEGQPYLVWWTIAHPRPVSQVSIWMTKQTGDMDPPPTMSLKRPLQRFGVGAQETAHMICLRSLGFACSAWLRLDGITIRPCSDVRKRPNIANFISHLPFFCFTPPFCWSLWQCYSRYYM